MTQSVMYLSALRAFEAAARHESFAKAAAELNVSHSVVSQHIRNLEAWLHTSLFVRHGNRVELTEEARLFASRISEGFQIIQETCNHYRGTYGAMSLTVKAEPAFATRWLRRRLLEFQSAHPNIAVQLLSNASRPNMRDGITDIALHFDSVLINEGASQDRVFPIDTYPACSPDFLQTHATRLKQLDFEGLPLVHDNSRTVWRQWFNKYLPESEAWKQGNVYSDFLMALDSAKEGDGIFLADDIICQKEMQDGSLVKLDSRTLRSAWYHMAYSASPAINPAVAIFRTWLLNASADQRAAAERIA